MFVEPPRAATSLSLPTQIRHLNESAQKPSSATLRRWSRHRLSEDHPRNVVTRSGAKTRPGSTSGHTHLVLGWGKSSERSERKTTVFAPPDIFSRSLTATGNTSDRAPARLRIGSIGSFGETTIETAATLEPEPVESLNLSPRVQFIIGEVARPEPVLTDLNSDQTVACGSVSGSVTARFCSENRSTIPRGMLAPDQS